MSKVLMITIYIENRPYKVKPEQNLLQACLSLGFDLPYFCWHPALHSVGACRQCAVKLFRDEKDVKGRIVMSCMTPVADGMRLSIDDPDARAFRASVIEWLMLNHPHDCPVCDEGGECHLQDMTVMTGHTLRRSRFPKRTHRNQDLGPFINHEMNRCIQCYRCVRYYRGTAGGRDLNVFASHDHVYFGRSEDGVLESEFSGNLVEICPTGVFTDKTLKDHYARKWDLQTAPSLCVHCGVGCNITPGERGGTLRRILNRHNHDVNGYFLCDRGRFGYGFVNSDRRIRVALTVSSEYPPQSPLPESISRGQVSKGESATPLAKGGSGRIAVAKQDALARIEEILSSAKGVIGIGSPRASLESNFVLRSLVGENNFFSGLSGREQELASLIVDIQRNSPSAAPTLREMRSADAILILGEDVSNTAPMIAFAVRQAAGNRRFDIAAGMKLPLWDDAAVRNAGQDAKSPVYIISPAATRLDDLAVKTHVAPPNNIARLGALIAHEIDKSAPKPSEPYANALPLAKEIAAVLLNARRPLILSGAGCLSPPVIHAAANIAWALHASGRTAHLSYALHECNTMGAALLAGRPLNDALTAVRDGQADTIIILENDLYRRAAAETIDAFLGKSKNVIVLDHLMHRTAEEADIVLPAATFAEASGTHVNYESRAQRFYQVFVPEGDIQAGWKWIHDIMRITGTQSAEGKPSWDDVVRRLASTLPVFGPIRELAPAADFRLIGMKVPRQAHRASGRTSIMADRTMHEPRPEDDPDSPLAFSLEGYEGQPPAALLSRTWAPGWNSVQSLNRFQQEIGGPLREDASGKRLIIPSQGHALEYFTVVIPSGAPGGTDDEAPLYDIFTSDELSSYSAPVAARSRTVRSGGRPSPPDGKDGES